MTNDIVMETDHCDIPNTALICSVCVVGHCVHFYVTVEPFGLTFTIIHVKKLFVLKYQNNY